MKISLKNNYTWNLSQQKWSINLKSGVPVEVKIPVGLNIDKKIVQMVIVIIIELDFDL